MKSTLFCLIASSALLAPVAYSATPSCVGGQLITANSMTSNPNNNCTASTCNGETYCLSDGVVYWWSAFLWCQRNNRELVSVDEACPGAATEEKNQAGACPNLQGRLSGSSGWWAWTATKIPAAVLAVTSNGEIPHSTRTASGKRALCK